MIAMVPISNQLIGRAGFNVEQLVLQDILTAISVREDKAFMRDDGTGDTPIGMKARATQWNRLLPWEADAAINLNTVDEYLDKIILMAMDGNSLMIRCGWGMSNRTYMKLFGLRDGNGNKVYPEMAQGCSRAIRFSVPARSRLTWAKVVRKRKFISPTSMMLSSVKMVP
jgi:HK97 family phage major capsid protein